MPPRLPRSLSALSIAALLVLGSPHAPAAPTQATVLSEVGTQLQSQYAEQLKTLRAEITAALPTVDPAKAAALKSAREATLKAQANVDAAQKDKNQINTAKGLVEHAKNKWIAGADKGIAAAEAALKQAKTDEERDVAKADLAKWQANREEGLKALQERTEALVRAQAEDATRTQQLEAAQSALADARAAEFAAARAVLADLEAFLSSDALDAKLARCVVLAQATPQGLAEYAQQSPQHRERVDQLLADPAMMLRMLEAGGARNGRFAQAMDIYSAIQQVRSEAHASHPILDRLALGTALTHAQPIAQRNAVTDVDAPKFVDPVKRYQHYEKAFLNGELDPAFATMSAWECQMIVNSYAPDHIHTWAREMLRNYRPDHIFNPDYGWRYTGIMRTDIAYRNSYLFCDTESLQFFPNILKNGGICGRRAFFGRFITKAFGLPTWGVAQHAHAAVGRWTPNGWVVNFGADWDKSWGPPEETEPGRRGTDFVLEANARENVAAFKKALRADWAAEALGEAKYVSTKPGSGEFWSTLALLQKQLIFADNKPGTPGALGQELGEANESAETRATAVAKATITDADKQVIVDKKGVITLPVAACSGGLQPMNSFLGGVQAFCNGEFTAEVDVEKAGMYRLTLRVVTVRDNNRLNLTVNGDTSKPLEIYVPYTLGRWESTQPLAITLKKGKNVLQFGKPSNGFTLKSILLTPGN